MGVFFFVAIPVLVIAGLIKAPEMLIETFLKQAGDFFANLF